MTNLDRRPFPRYIPSTRRSEGDPPLTDRLERYRWLIAAIFIVPLVSGIAFLIRDSARDPEPLTIDPTGTGTTDIRVYISGAVQNPGVYPAQPGDRWIDVLETAGGATSDADLNAVNLSRRVQDEDQIIVPGLGQTAVSGASRSPLVNINTASETELEALPGIGEVRAGQIVQSRSSDGPFATVDELLVRELVPQSVFEDIAPLITASQ